ncbi:MAG TPA: amidohydrolase family protein, partial [Flavitalea sp.]|nr:amidohydrolase family protein [Flavitalea sp.]
LNVMSKYFNLGMSIEDVVLRATWNAAKSIKKEDLGSLTVGSAADIALIRITEGDFGYIDAGGFKLKGNKKLIAELTVRAGKVVWDLNGLSGKPLEK